MNKLAFFLTVLLIPPFVHGQRSQAQGNASQWVGQRQNITEALGAEVLGTGRTEFVGPILMPATGRSWVPGGETNWVPILEGDEPLNLAPSDTQAFILYQRATAAFRRGDGNYTDLYRDLIRRFPRSSYTPYAIYSLASVETDYRMKIRMLLSLKENNPDFPHMNRVLEVLGDIYYLMGVPDAAKEVFLEAAALTNDPSPYASYMLAVLALDSSRVSSTDSRRREADNALRGGEAIQHIRRYIASKPNPENSYRAYVLYAEALLLQKRYTDTLTVLSNAANLRPWAYDNGLNVLFYAGEAFYFEGKKLLAQRRREYAAYYNQSLYAFSLLRLRFARSAEARLADQFISSLERGNALRAQPVPWIARNFETIIKPRPEVRFQAPVYGAGRTPAANLPQSITPPDTDFAFLGDMPVPRRTVPPNHEVYIPALPERPQVSILTFTNRVSIPVTNTLTNVVTNRIFAMLTNVVTNQFASVFQTYVTNTVASTNYITEQRGATNYELIPVYVTNEVFVNTNTITNIVDVYITNTAAELVLRDITNVRPSYITNSRTNFVDVIITNQAIELIAQTNLIPIYITNTNTIVREVTVTNAVGELALRSITNNVLSLRTNVITNIIDRYITNQASELVVRNVAQTNLVPIYITNTNTIVREVTVTNAVGELALRSITNNVLSLRTNVITNIIDRYITNQASELVVRNVAQTNLVPVYVTNTNTIVREVAVTNAVGELILRSITNNVLTLRTNVITNIIDRYITNQASELVVRNVAQTNLVPIYITNTNTIVREVTVTNAVGELILRSITNNVLTLRTNMITNIVEIPITNAVSELALRSQTITNFVPVYVTNYATNIRERVITNTLTQAVMAVSETNFIPVYRTNVLTNIVDAAVTNRVLYQGLAQDVTNIVPIYITNRLTNIVDVPVTNTVNRIFISNVLVPVTNVVNGVTNVVTNIIDAVITNTLREVQIVPQTNTVLIPVPAYTNVNVRDFVITNIFNQVQTNFIDEIMTNLSGANIQEVQTNLQVTIDPVTEIPVTNIVINSNTVSFMDTVEMAPIALGNARPLDIEPPQLQPLQEPVYEIAVPDSAQIIALQDAQVVRLQQQASTLAEKASSIAGGYQYGEARGYVVRIAQVADLAVANLIVKEINKADSTIAVGIYYRDEIYYLEVRNIRSYEEALELSQRLYQMGFTDTQIFERYELTQYTS